MTLFGPSLAVVVVLVNVPGYARIVRMQTMALRSAEHIDAARSMGTSTARILRVHVLPNVIGPVVIAIEAGMSFLGLGVRPPRLSRGAILDDGFVAIRDTPWIVLAGGIPIVVTTLGFTFLGETLRDAFGPRLKGR